MKGLREATVALTRARVGPSSSDPAEVARGVPWFPIVGALLGLCAAAVYAIARIGLTPIVGAAVAIGSTIWITGAFHEDGLADTADALGSRATGADAVRILRDPALGTFGVLALVFSVLVRVGTLASMKTEAAFMVLPAAHAMSRAGAAVLLLGPTLGSGGLAASLMPVVTRRHVAAGAVTATALGMAALGPLVIGGVLLVGLTSGLVAVIARRRFGGISGDLVGAAQQLGEIGLLLVGAYATGAGWLELPWWRGLNLP